MIPTTYNELSTADFIRYFQKGFLNNFEVLKSLPTQNLDIGLKSVGQKILLQETLTNSYINSNDVYLVIHKAVAIYHADKFDSDKLPEIENQILELPITQIFPTFVKLVSELERVLKLESKLKSRNTDEQVRAGINNFNEFGHFGTLYALSKHLMIPITEVEKIDYYTAYNVLKYEFVSAEFNKKYQEILSKKK